MPSMDQIGDWLANTPLGVVAVIVGLIVAFLAMAALSERKTKRMFPDKAKQKKGQKRD